MHICTNCKRPILTKGDFEKMVGKPYLMALADKEFMKKMEEEQCVNTIQ